MRRPRYKLQVSTFPFLAVLLCAMGSLLLFLFIMDRRAKIAAQHMNDEALQERKKRTKDEEDRLQADWEKAKEKLHQALLLQQGQLAKQEEGLQIDLDGAGKKLQLVQTQHLDFDEQAKAEAGKIAEIQLQIAGRRAGLLHADKMETMSKKELLAAAQELAELEIAFQQLLALKEREKQVHSLVPYHGKRGDSRTPIYIECVRDGVIFHPDDRLLQGYEFTPGSVRIEVERRGSPLVPAKASDAKLPAEEKKGVYVLFLVRPSGIGSYYRAQAALKGYRLDFGYELIDQDWELDFGGTGYVKNRPLGVPAKRTEMPIDTRPIIEPTTPIYVGGSGPLPPPGSGPPSTGFVTGPIGIPAPGGEGGLPGLGAGGGSGTPGSGASVGSGAGGGSGGPGKGPAFVPLNKFLPPVPIASTDGPGSGLAGNPGGGTGSYPPGAGSNPPGGAPYPAGGTGTNPPGGTPYPGGGTGTNPPGGTPYPGGGTGSNPPGGTPSPNNGGAGTGNPNSGGGAPATGNPKDGGQNPSANPAGQGIPGAPNATGKPGEAGASGSGNSGSGGSGDGSAEIGPPSSFGGFGNTAKTAKKTPSTPALSKLLGNKDFLITIDCYNDHVNVFPGGMSFRWTAATMKTTDQAFAQAVANLIERRQASVRPGEPPYRPLICFRVTPDGRPACLHVYPLLEPLHVPMTRENVVE